MKKSGLIAALALLAITGTGFAADAIGYTDTPMQPNGKWHVHDINRPRPQVITPGAASTPEQSGTAPSDAVVLFDGKDLAQWSDGKGQPTKWKVVNGAMECVPKSGYIQTKKKFGDVQLHLEFATPTPPKGNSQGRGNSGLFFADGKYEIQVLDSFDNITYADGQCSAVYGQYPPLVNASRKPGEWQTYDVIYHMPKFSEDGKVEKPATFTVFHNGVLTQDHTEAFGGTNHKQIKPYVKHGAGSIQLQDHGNPVRYRNIWVRELKERGDN